MSKGGKNSGNAKGGSAKGASATGGGSQKPKKSAAAKGKAKGKGSGSGSGKADEESIKLVARNRKARFEFEILDKYEAGIVLTGTEVKSLRNGKANLVDSYARVDREEVWLLKMHIPEYEQRGYATHDPTRKRKLLLHKREIQKLIGKMQEKGLTLIPIAVYFKRGIAKVELALGRGKKLHDKREAIKKRSVERDLRRIAR